MKILMMSGGLDSTYMCWNFLKNYPDEKYHIHHVSMRNNIENRFIQEDAACASIIKLFKQQGFKFEYSESIHDFRNNRAIGFDSDWIILTARDIAISWKTEVSVEACLGWLVTDNMFNFLDISNNTWQALLQSAPKRVCRVTKETLTFPLIEVKLRKEDLIRKLPKVYLDKIWYCRRPKENLPCNKCVSCVAYNKALKTFTSQ